MKQRTRLKPKLFLGLKAKSWLSILIVILFVSLFVVPLYYVNEGQKVLARNIVYAKVPDAKKEAPTETRAQKVYTYLQSKNSPLADYAEVIVKESDTNDIPWTLVVAISGKESSFGKAIKPGSFNAWGIMQWDKAGKRSIRSFNSWEQAIAFEAKLLGDNYRENMYRGIQQKYCPSFECSDTWVAHVTGFSEEINK